MTGIRPWQSAALFAAAYASLVNAAELSPTEIVARAHAAAGGAFWVNPQTLSMDGYGLFYDGATTRRHEQHRMWRVYPASKAVAHQADGKVRIDSVSNGKVVFQVSWDGERTYTQAGPIADRASASQWQASFGFGAIRFALSDGYRLERLPNDHVDGHATYTVKVVDPSGGATLFGIDQKSYRIRWLGFDTPRGWHERRYSEFFEKPGVRWVQPGRVRLYYDGVKSNEIVWTDFRVNEPIADELFVLPDEPR
ncbi:MAG: hypothetical protein AAFX44_00925 [Pseudomonadota bacterium]